MWPCQTYCGCLSWALILNWSISRRVTMSFVILTISSMLHERKGPFPNWWCIWQRLTIGRFRPKGNQALIARHNQCKDLKAMSKSVAETLLLFRNKLKQIYYLTLYSKSFTRTSPWLTFKKQRCRLRYTTRLVLWRLVSSSRLSTSSKRIGLQVPSSISRSFHCMNQIKQMS